MRRTLVGCVVLGLALGASFAQASDWHGKVDPWVLDTAARGDTEFLVMLRLQLYKTVEGCPSGLSPIERQAS